MERKGSGAAGGRFIALGGSVGCFERVTQLEWHGDLPVHRDCKDCHLLALLGPGEKEKQPGPNI